MAVAAVVATQGGRSRGTREVEVQVGAKRGAYQVQWYEIQSIPSREQSSKLGGTSVSRCSSSGQRRGSPGESKDTRGREASCLPQARFYGASIGPAPRR